MHWIIKPRIKYQCVAFHMVFGLKKAIISLKY